MADERAELGASVERLRALVEPLGPDDVRRPSYCGEWSIAQVLSHLGSGAVIGAARLGEGEVDPQPVWDEWNAKDADAMVADALAADAAYLERLDALPEAERADLRVSFGPMELGYDEFIGFRLNEHVVHTWDVAVALDPTARLPEGPLGSLLGAVPMLAGFAGKPTGVTRDVVVATTDPERRYVVSLTEVGTSAAPVEGDADPDLTMPAEALVRLVYGRLDPDHTPPVTGDEAALDDLRRAFPGV